MQLIFKDRTFSYETLRTLSYAAMGGADVGEVLMTAQKIKEGDFDSWFAEWFKLAQQLKQRGQQFESQKQQLSASQSYFKAANYYRTAEFFLHGDSSDPRLLSTWQASRQTFRKALALGQLKAEIVQIPYERTSLPAYFYRVDDQPRPTLIVHGGYDSTGEELYFQVAQDALKHGYNCLTFEGPGQGAMIREQHLPFRPDWEKVVTPVIDYLLARPEVIKHQISLMGISFGGLLAPRAAAFDHRLAAVIADDGLFAFQFEAAFQAHGHDTNDFEQIEKQLRLMMQAHSNVRWVIENGLYTFGATSIQELFKKTRPYTLAGLVEQIQCPVLVCEAENDMFFKGQPEMLYQGLRSPKTLMHFGKGDGAEEHCQMGALQYYNQRVFGWLDQVMAK